MSPTQQTILTRLSQFDRDVRHFTSSTNENAADVVMSAPTALKALKALIGLGYVRLLDTGSYRITYAGRLYLDRKDQTKADYSRIPTGVYVPDKWHVREDGEQFLKIRSRGML